LRGVQRGNIEKGIVYYQPRETKVWSVLDVEFARKKGCLIRSVGDVMVGNRKGL